MPNKFARSRFNPESLKRGIELLYRDGSPVAAEWRAAHLASVLRISPFTMASNIGSSLLVLWSFRQKIPVGLAYWAAAISIMSLLTIAKGWRRRGCNMQRASRRAFRRATVHACLMAGAWAVMPVIWFPHGTPEQQITIAALTTGMLSAGAFVLSPLPLASLAYGAIYALAALVALWRTDNLSLLGTEALMCVYAPTVLIGAMSSWHKSTTQLAIQGQIARRERLLAVLLQDFEQHADEALWEIDQKGRLRHFSPRLAEFLQMSERGLTSGVFLDVLALTCPNGVDVLQEAFSSGHVFREIPLFLSQRRPPRHLTISGKRVFDEDGYAIGWRGVVADVTDKVEADRRLVLLAHTDALTGLANRLTLWEALAQRIRDSGSGALLTIDLDHFKSVNDGLGHSVGDELLKAVALRLQGSVRKNDLVARLGGDEFAIVISPIDTIADAESVASGIVGAMRQPFLLGDRQFEIGASVGVTAWTGTSAVAEELLLHADVALYQAKELGRSRFASYNPALGARAQRRLRLEEGLRRAVERGELALFWQPKVEVGSDRIIGAEALMRWTHPDLGAIAPAEFIPIAEQCGLIHELGEWALREACRVGAQCLPGLNVSVNVSTVQLLSGHLVAQVREALETSSIAPGLLELEITESVFLREPEQALAQLRAIRGGGVNLALDDFGTGYSSLAYLRKFPFNTIKIDRSFVIDLPSQPDARLMVSTIVLMADALGLRTICEGVETGEQLAELVQAGCSEYQGYLASPPLPLNQFLELCRARQGHGLPLQSA